MGSCADIASLVSDFQAALCSPPPAPVTSESASAVDLPERGSFPVHPPPPGFPPPPATFFPHPIPQMRATPPPQLMAPPAFNPHALSELPSTGVRLGGGSVIYSRANLPVPSAGFSTHDIGFDPQPAAPAMQRTGSNEHAGIEAIPSAAPTSISQEAALPSNHPVTVLPAQPAGPAPLPPLHGAYCEYTLELSKEDYCVLALQLIMDPPDCSTAVVACCHRLPLLIQKDIRHGSRLLEMLLFDSRRNTIHEFKPLIIPLAQLQAIAALYPACQSIRIKFSVDVLPAYVPFIIPDFISECCMRIGCKKPLKAGGRHHCRCCGLLCCSKCSDHQLVFSSHGKQLACKDCHALFSSSPDSIWRPEWVISKRDESFRESCERLTNALDLIEKKPHAARLGLDVTRLWSATDPEFKRQMRLLQRSHPDANIGKANASVSDFSQIQVSCTQLLDRLSEKELLYQCQFASSCQATVLIDGACNVCHQMFKKFSIFDMFVSKHYCRICGLAVCSRKQCCSPSSTLLPPNFGFGSNPVSVCTVCCATLVANSILSGTTLVGSSGGAAVAQTGSSVAATKSVSALNPLVLWRDGGVELFARVSAPPPQAASPYMSQLQVVCSVIGLNAQTARLSLFFCPSLEQHSSAVKENLGSLTASVTRPFSAFEVLRKCLMNQGYPSYIIPELNSVDVASCHCFMNAVFQHKRLRNSALVPLFCASSDEWGEELHRVLLRVSQSTDMTLSSEISIKSSPLSLPWTAIQQLLGVLRSHGMYSLWAPLVVKFFSLSEFLEYAQGSLRQVSDRMTSYQARVARFAERSKRHENFVSMFNENRTALEALKTRSYDRFARERIRLVAQKSSVHPVLTRRQQDADERQADTLLFEICLSKFEEESVRFCTDKQMAENDRFENCLIQETSSKALSSQATSNPQVEWIFDSLSSVHAGLDSIALMRAIKEQEEQAAEHRNLLRTQLHAENKDLVDENQNLQAEIDDLCDEENQNGGLFMMNSLNQLIVELKASAKCELEDVDNETRLRLDKERRVEEEMNSMDHIIQKCEELRKQRLNVREAFQSKMSNASENIKTIVMQLMAAVPLLQQSLAQSAAAEDALRLLVETQTRETCAVVLEPVCETLDSVFNDIRSRRESAAALLDRRSVLLDETAMILTQVNTIHVILPVSLIESSIILTRPQAQQLHEDQIDPAWFLPEDFSFEAKFSFEIDENDDIMVAFRSKRAAFSSRVSVLRTAFRNWEPELLQSFQLRVQLFASDRETLQLNYASAAFREFEAVKASVASWDSLFIQESQVIDNFQRERYSKPIEELFKRMARVMDQTSVLAQDHKNRIRLLKELQKEYDGA